MSKLKKLEVEIEFKEGGYTSHEQGHLEEESIQQIKELFLNLIDSCYHGANAVTPSYVGLEELYLGVSKL